MSALPLPRTAARRILIAAAAVVVALAAVAALTSSSATAASRGPHDQPAAGQVPAPVPVSVDPATTAYLVLDMTNAVCGASDTCLATVPAAARLLAKARAAGALVVYSQTGAAGSAVLPQLAPQPADPIVTAHADKFLGTSLDDILSSAGIKTLVIVGTAVNGAVLYTSFEADLRGFTVVVARDGVSAASGFILRYSLFQLLNQPGATNADNTPLTPDAVTLSTTSLVTFAAAS